MNGIKKLKSTENISFLTTFIIGFATHLFGFVNVIHNYDDIAVLPAGSGTGITSGRWFLTILDSLFSKIGITYNLPYVNAILFILLISISVKFIIRLLEIENLVSAILVGAIFVTFPSTTSAMFFKYTTITYGIAILFSVLAVWLAKRYTYGFVLSGFLIACSLGIYQAYVPITITLIIILLLQEALIKDTTSLDVIKQGLKYAGTLLLGIATYFVLLNGCLVIYDTQLSTYQGVDKMGAIDLAQLPSLLVRIYREFFGMIFADYKGVSQTAIIRFCLLLFGCICIGLIIFILKINRKKWDIVLLTVLLCAVLPIAVNFIVIMCPTSIIYTLMVHSFALVFTLPFMLLEIAQPLPFVGAFGTYCKKYVPKVILAGALIVSLSYAYLANLNYTQLYYTTRKTENYMTSLVSQVRMTEGFDTSMKWAFIGDSIQDPLLYDNWEWTPHFGANPTPQGLINSYSRISWIVNYAGYNIPLVSKEQLVDLGKCTEIKSMPCFPNDGSIRVMDDIIIIKLENEK